MCMEYVYNSASIVMAIHIFFPYLRVLGLPGWVAKERLKPQICLLSETYAAPWQEPCMYTEGE